MSGRQTPLIFLQCLGGRAVEHDATGLEQQHPVTKAFDRHQVVADQHHGLARLCECGHARQRAFLEGLVPDGQHLVDQQDVGVDMHRDGKAQPHIHSG